MEWYYWILIIYSGLWYLGLSIAGAMIIKEKFEIPVFISWLLVLPLTPLVFLFLCAGESEDIS